MANISDQVANGAIEDAGKYARQIAKQVKRLLEALITYLEFHAKTEEQRILAKYLKDGGTLAFCTDKVDAGKLMYELEKEGIAKIKTNNGRVIVRREDLPKVAKIERRLIVAEGRYYQMVPYEEMSDAVARSDSKNKNLFVVNGLDHYEIESLKNKCNSIKAGFQVATEKTGKDSYKFAVKESELYKEPRYLSSGKQKQDKDFSRAYLESMLSLYGPNRENKLKQIDADRKFDDDILARVNSGEVSYIISVDDPKKYIELNATGFTVCNVSYTEDGKYVVNKDVNSTVSTQDPNFTYELQRETDAMYNKAILSDNDTLNKHLSTKERNIVTDRPGLSGKMFAYAKANDKLAETIDKMVRAKVNQIGYEKAEDKFNAYVEKSKEILSDLINDKQIEGYDEKDVSKLEAIINEKEIDRDDYSSCVETFGKLDRQIVRAEKAKDIDTVQRRFDGVKGDSEYEKYDR